MFFLSGPLERQPSTKGAHLASSIGGAPNAKSMAAAAFERQLIIGVPILVAIQKPLLKVCRPVRTNATISSILK